MGFLNTAKIRAGEIYSQAVEFLRNMYAQSHHPFTPASPFGQILTVLTNIAELIMSYLEHAVTELNIHEAQTIESIYGLAQLTGHQASRGSSARGMIGLLASTSARNEVKGHYITIDNFTKFRIADNSLDYFIKLNSDFIKIPLDDRSAWIDVEFMEGRIESETFTGTGERLQSFNISTKDMTDDDYIVVTVNGEVWQRKESLYDMNPNEKCFLCRTSINTGLSIFFGNGSFGQIPQEGAVINVDYVITSGASGSLNTSTFSLKFLDSGSDEFGNEVNLNECIVAECVQTPMFGADSESIDFTRVIAPHASKSFVLANPENYMAYLSKYDEFGSVYAYNTKEDGNYSDDNTIYLELIPNMKKRITATDDYFSTPISTFEFNDTEKAYIHQLINKSGRQLVTAELVINNFEIKKYALNIVVSTFEGYDQTDIKSKIRAALSKYFININRRDIIPRSDIVAIVEKIEGVDSVAVFFLSEENENAIRNKEYNKRVYIEASLGIPARVVETTYHLADGENPSLGIDNLGNIKIAKGELAIIRGGWTDRNGKRFDDDVNNEGLSGLNVFFTNKVDNSSYNRKQQQALEDLLEDIN